MKINITEEEKRNILKMHKSLISEQSQVSKLSATNSGGANKQYCTNMEKQMEKEFDPRRGLDLAVKNLTIVTQPDPSKSQFGIIKFDRSHTKTGGVAETITLNCGPNNVQSATSTKFKEWKSNPYNDGIYAQYCSRINTCAGFVA
jgi:hypothetical protein